MRDLTSQELTHVYGAGSRGKSYKPPKHKSCRPKNKHRGGGSGSGSGGRGGSGSGSGRRHGKGGSS